MIRLPFSLSPGPVNARRQVPPYFPISWSGLITSGSAGRRCSTGGSLPALTSSASIGASLKLLGNWAGSVMTVGPSSLPIRLAPSLASGLPAAGAAAAGLAASVGLAAAGAAVAGAAGAAVGAGAAGAAGLAASVGFGASAGLAGAEV